MIHSHHALFSPIYELLTVLFFELAPIIVQIILVLSSLRSDWENLEGKGANNEGLVRLRTSGLMNTQSAILTEDESIFSSNDDA